MMPLIWGNEDSNCLSCMYLCIANSIKIVEGNSETKGGKGCRAFGTPVVLLRDPNK